MKRRLALVSLVSLALAPASALAQAGRRRRQERREERHDDVQDRVAEAMTGWTRLGERWVQPGGVDHDVIVVTAAEGTFRQVALRVEHSALELFDVTITFGDGQTFSPGTRLVFGRDTPSRTIDLPGGNRVIRRVDFRYANLPGGGRAQLELWAR
ncbi:MAG: hypothetical protein K1X94_12290 [Sandaracinaceae bacterium]|jgi:hypothetical protein|nr:hypothetical protein [Sandaracinaceae bacterium]